MNNFAKLIESRLWRREKKRKSDVQPVRPRVLDPGSGRQIRTSSPHSANKSANTNRTDPTLDHSLMSESTTHQNSLADSLELSTPESLEHGHFRQSATLRRHQHVPSRPRHADDCDNSSLTSHRTSDEELVDKTSPTIPRVVSSGDEVAYARHYRDPLSYQLRDTILGNGPINALFENERDLRPIQNQHSMVKSYSELNQSLDELTSRSDAHAASYTMTQASTQVATNRAIDLALRRIEQMQVQLQQEHDRLDALVANEASSAAVRQAHYQRQYRYPTNHSEPYHLRHGPEYLDASSVDAEVDVGLSAAPARTYTGTTVRGTGRLGEHVKRMQAKFLPKDATLYQQHSVSSSVQAEIDLDRPSTGHEAVKHRFQQRHGSTNAFHSPIEDNPFHNQLLLPVLSSPIPTRTLAQKQHVSIGTPDMVSPPAIQRFGYRLGTASVSLASNMSPDPVFCASPGTSTMTPAVASNLKMAPTDGSAAHTPAYRYALTTSAASDDLLSPDSIFASTFASSLQSSIAASDRATFMQDDMTMVTNTQQNTLHPSEVPQALQASSVRVQQISEARAVNLYPSQAPAGQHKESSQLVANDRKQQVLKLESRLLAHLVKNTASDSERHDIDNRSLDVQSLRATFETNQTSVKSCDEDEDKDDVSVKSLKEVFEAPRCSEPSAVSLMREKFESKKRVLEASQQFKQTVSKFDVKSTQRRQLPALTDVKPFVGDRDLVNPSLNTSATKGIALETHDMAKYLAKGSIKERIRAFEAAAQAQSASLKIAKSWNQRQETSMPRFDDVKASRSWSTGRAITGYTAETKVNTIKVSSDVIEDFPTSSGVHSQEGLWESSHSLPPAQRSGIEVYRESLHQHQKDETIRSKDKAATQHPEKSSNVITYWHNRSTGPKLPLVRPDVSTSTQEHRARSQSPVVEQSERDLRIQSSSEGVQSQLAIVQPKVNTETDPGDANVEKPRDNAIISDRNERAFNLCPPVEAHFVKLQTNHSDNCLSETHASGNVLRPTPVKLDATFREDKPTPSNPSITKTPFRPVSTTLSDTSFSRFSHSSLAMSETLLKFSRKARMEAMNAKPALNISGTTKTDPRRKAAAVHDGCIARAIQPSASPEADHHVPSNELQDAIASPRPEAMQSEIIEKGQVNVIRGDFDNEIANEGRSTDERSSSESSDGVTLDLSIADVSILTTPTALVSKAEDRGRTSVDEESSCASSEEDAQSSDDASSKQSSEAAIPLLAPDMQPRELSDDYSASVGSKSFFTGRAEKASSWLPGSSGNSTPSKENRDVDWDVSRVKSLFPQISASDTDIFDIDERKGTLRVTAGAQKQSSSRSTTPTRSNKTVQIVPTTRKYASLNASSVPGISINQYVESREEVQARRRASIPSAASSGEAVRLNFESRSHLDESSNDAKLKVSGFPLSRQLREQAYRTSQLNATMQNVTAGLASNRQARSEGSSALSRYTEEHAKLLTRIQRLREARIKRGVGSYPYESKAIQRNTFRKDLDEFSGSTQSSTKFGGQAFISSLDLD